MEVEVKVQLKTHKEHEHKHNQGTVNMRKSILCMWILFENLDP